MEERKDIRFIAFIDENNNKVEGLFEILLETDSIIKFKTEKNIITIPYSRLLKMKEKEVEK